MLKNLFKAFLLLALMSQAYGETKPKFSAVMTDDFSACAIDQDQELRCWGTDILDAANPPLNLGKIKALAIDDRCAINDSDELVCWGLTPDRKPDLSLKAPDDLGKVKQVHGGIAFRCALTLSDEVRCWGERSDSYVKVPADLGKVMDLAVGSGAVCAITTASELRCWGRSWRSNVTDIKLGALASFQKVFMGGSKVCGLDQKAKLHCWEFYGGDLGDARVREPILTGKAISGSMGWDDDCFVDASSEIHCSGRLGALKPAGLGKVKSVHVHNRAACAITNEEDVVCWNGFAYEDGTLKQTPDKMLGVTAIKGSRDYLCASWKNGDFNCWGIQRPLMDDDKVNPKPENLNKNVLDFSLASYHACAIRENGRLACWGMNHDGQLDIPRDLHSASQVAVSSRSTCALEKTGEAICWGLKISREDRRRGVRPPPFKIDVPSRVPRLQSLEGGDADHYCGLDLKGRVWCWGNNHAGQINVPKDLPRAVKVATGGSFTCALLESGKIQCWGEEKFSGAMNVPADLGDALDLDIYSSKVCAITKKDNGLHCWGSPGPGSAIPPRGFGPVDWVSAIGQGVCTSTIEGRLRCWGNYVN